MADEPQLAVLLDSAQRGKGPYLWRFNVFDRVIHGLLMTTFYTLVLTGMPLRFTCAPWSEPLVNFWGGVTWAGRIHRIAAAIMIGFTVVYVFRLGYRFVKSREKAAWVWGSDSMVPHPQDAVDFLKMWGWFFGKSERPKFGRYGYLEKLDYLGEVWGFIVIGGSGILLWFHEFWSQFLPGWTFNVATVFHGYEAMIATGFIFVVHLFNVHLRPDKFPLDAVMFTGRATKDYMEEEHPLVMERVAPRLNDEPSKVPITEHVAPPPSAMMSFVGTVLGFIALSVGLALAGMIAWSVFFC